MLHNNQPTTTTAATTTDGHGTEPTIATTHLAAATSAAAASPPKEIDATPPPPTAAAEGQPLTAAAAGTTASLSAVETADVVAAAADAAACAGSEPTAFDAQMRTQQRQKIKIYHDARQTAVWRTDSLASNPNSTMCPDFGSSGAAGGGTGALGVRGIILSTAPSLLQRKASDSSLTSSSIPRRVSFPENQLVTGYLEPADPWKQGKCAGNRKNN